MIASVPHVNIYKGGLAIGQINLNFCKAANEALPTFVEKFNIDIVAFQDPYIYRNKIVGLDSYTCFTSESNNAGILICNSALQSIKIDAWRNSVAANLQLQNGEKLLIVSQYSAPSGNLESDLEKWKNCLPLDKNFILMGDLNARNALWGYSRNDGRGEVILDFCFEKDLVVINDKTQPPSFYMNENKGYPDMTIASSDIKDKFFDWTVLDDFDSASDHRYIMYKFDATPITVSHQRYNSKFYSIAQARKLMYPLLLSASTRIESCHDSHDINEFIDSFTDDLTQVCDKIFKKKKVQPRANIKWWTDDLRMMRNKLKALHIRLKRDPTLQNNINYKKHRALYKIKIKESKSAGWKRFCSSCTDTYGKAFKVFKDDKFGFKNLVHVRLCNLPNDSSYLDVNNCLLETHFHEKEGTEYDDFDLVLRDKRFQEVGFKEIEEAIKSSNKSKAPGLDRIDTRMIQVMFKVYPNFFTTLFNKLLGASVFPEKWKLAKVVFFVKKNRNPTSPASYRPVCLLQSISKIFEKVLHNRIIYYLETNNKLFTEQYGFREGRGTTDCINAVLEEIKARRTTSKYVGIVSFDIKGAFDNADWKKIMHALHNLGTPDYLLAILTDYFNNRHVCTQDSADNKLRIAKGCPQGSCLGPLLWTTLVNGILGEFRSESGKLLAYADDFVLITSGDSRQKLEDDTNRLIKVFERKCSNLNLQISQEKTVGITFGKNLKRRPSFKLNNRNLKIVSSFKYLGLTIDNKLTFQKHLDTIKTDILDLCLNTSRVSGLNWGINVENLIVWYRTVVEAKILYASEVYYPLLNSRGIQKLTSLQRLFLLKIFGSYRSTSTEALQIIAGILPIDLKAKEKFLKYEILKRNKQHFLDGRNYAGADFERTLKKCKTDPTGYPTNLTVTVNKDEEKAYYEKEETVIFTDGSKGEDGTGYAAVIVKDYKVKETLQVKLRNQNSVFQAEFLALRDAIQWSISQNIPRVKIFSDSQSVLMATQNLYPRSDCVGAFLRNLANSSLEVSCSWVRGHSGDPGNELADTLAKDALMLEDVFEHPYPQAELKAILKRVMLQEWTTRWEYSHKGRGTFEIFDTVSLKNRVNNKILAYFVTGHGSFPTFLFKIGKMSNPRCTCGDIGDPHHYLQTRCKDFPIYIKRHTNESIEKYFSRIDRGKAHLEKVKQIYNELNKRYSFITKVL